MRISSQQKNRAALGAGGKSPYTYVFNSENPALETVEKDYFFKALAAKELGIDRRDQDFLGLKLPEGLSDETQAVYDRQIVRCAKNYTKLHKHIFKRLLIIEQELLNNSTTFLILLIYG